MGKLVGIYNTSHTPFCFMPPQAWNAVRATRALREDVPLDDDATNNQKFDRIQTAFATLRTKLAEAHPDVVVVFGDDQMECFDFSNFPSFAVYVGEDFEGALSSPQALVRDAFDSVGVSREAGADKILKEIGAEDAGPPGRAKLKGHPQLGVSILTGLMKRGFDPAFSMGMPKPEDGVGHAFLRPAETLTDMQTPIVPILLNCYYAPQVTGKRAYQLGKAVRDVIEEAPSDLRVAVIGSGGLWHTPGAKGAYVDEEFDLKGLRYMEAGDIKGMAEHFDSYEIPSADTSQPLGGRNRSSTGMPGVGGPQGGTRETCNWIAASAVADGTPGKLVDYVPVFGSPIGCGFAYWDSF
jgi:Catalytic LigB subunit of aromatic ring-opening dioxygenase